jgi:hypothetical protein
MPARQRPGIHLTVLDPDRCLVKPREKGSAVRSQRLGERLPWIAEQGSSTHCLRHTTLT